MLWCRLFLLREAYVDVFPGFFALRSTLAMAGKESIRILSFLMDAEGLRFSQSV